MMTLKENLKLYITKPYLKRYLVYLIAISFLGLGVALIFQTNFGNAAWDAFHKNLHLGLGIDYKFLYPISSGIIVSIAYLIEWKRPNIAMVIPVLLSMVFGTFVDMYILFIPAVSDLSFLINLAYFMTALVVIVTALNLIRYCNFPLPAIDQLCLAIGNRFKLTFGLGKLLGELIAVVLSITSGFIFGYVDAYFNMGIATIFFIIFLGPLVDLLRDRILRIMKGIPTVDLIADDLEETDLIKKPTNIASRAIIVKGDDILVNHFIEEDYYVFPGGQKKSHETLEHCLRRNVKEETGYAIKKIQEKVIITEYFQHKTFKNHYFICHLKNDKIYTGSLKESINQTNQDIKPIWIKKDELLNLFNDHDSTYKYGHSIMWREFLGLINSL